MGSTVATVVVLMLSTVTDLLDTFDVSIMRARTMGLLGKAARSRHGVDTTAIAGCPQRHMHPPARRSKTSTVRGGMLCVR